MTHTLPSQGTHSRSRPSFDECWRLVTVAGVLMAVHVPHAHYFPVLLYGAAVAGIGGLATQLQRKAKLRQRQLVLWIGAVFVIVGTVLGLSATWHH